MVLELFEHAKDGAPKLHFKSLNTADYNHFIKRQLAPTELTLELYVITSLPKFGGDETFFAHRVGGAASRELLSSYTTLVYLVIYDSG